MNIKSLWLGLLLLGWVVGAGAQNVESPSLSNAFSGQKTPQNSYLSRMVYAIVSGDSLWQQLDSLSDLKGLLRDWTEKNKLPFAGEFSKLEKMGKKAKGLKNAYQSTTVSMNYYATNAQDSTEMGSGRADFMNMNVALGFEVMGLPLSVQSSVVMREGKFDTDFSSTNLSVNLNKYQDDWRSKLSKQTLQEQFNFDKNTEGVKLAHLDSLLLSKDMVFTLYEGLMNNPKVIALREKVLQRLDSLKDHTIEKYAAKLDTLKMQANDTFFKTDSLSTKKVGKHLPNQALLTDSTLEKTIEGVDLKTLNVDSLKQIWQQDTGFWPSKLTGKERLELDTLLKTQKLLHQITHKYDSLWHKHKAIVGQMAQLKNKFSMVETAFRKFENTDSLCQYALKSGGLTLKDKLMLKIKSLEMGQFGADEQDFLLKNQLLNGLKFEYGEQRKTWGILVGRSRFQALNAPVFYNPFQRLTQGRAFVLVKMSQLLRDSSRLTLRLMNVHKTQDSLFQGSLTPNYNSVLGVTYDKKIAKKWSIETDVALSNVRQTAMPNPNDGGNTPSLRTRNWAAATTLNWQRWEGVQLGLGYYYVGDGFYTFGNDFLINNRNGVKADMRLSLFKKRLKIEAELKRGVLNTPQQAGLQAAALLQINSSATWQLGKGQTLQFQYMPNTLTERPVHSSGRGFDYQSNIYLLTGNFSYKWAKMAQKTLIMLSNVNQQVDFFDTLQVTKTHFTNCRHEWVLSPKNSMILKVNGGMSDAGVVQTGQIQMDTRWNFGKKAQLTTGLQAVKKRLEPDWRAGVVAQFNAKIGTKLMVRSGFIYRPSLKNTEGVMRQQKNEWIVNAALTAQF